MKPADLAVARASFAVYEGDALSLLNVLRAFRRKSSSASAKECTAWCRKRLLNLKMLQRALSVREQLARYMRRFGIAQTRAKDAPSLGGITGTDAIRKALVCGYFSQAANSIDGSGHYKACHGASKLRLHHNSVLYKAPPDWLVYHETVVTEHQHILSATKIEYHWLAELAPHFYEIRHQSTA